MLRKEVAFPNHPENRKYILFIPTECEELIAAIDRIPGQSTVDVFTNRRGRTVIEFQSEISQAGVEGFAHILKWVTDSTYEVVPPAGAPSVSLGLLTSDCDDVLRRVTYQLTLRSRKATESLLAGLKEPVQSFGEGTGLLGE